MSLEGLQLGQYRLLRLIGSGGMGEVYLAEDARINQQVAIKLSRTEATPYPEAESAKEAARLFQREAKAIAQLDHPRILPLFSYGEEEVNGATLTYIVMPFRKEGSLTTWLRQRKNTEGLSPQDVAHIVNQAADALQYAHDRHIVHQDVKPSNFLIRSHGETDSTAPELLLTDFGIAKLSTATSSASHTVRGTTTYMAPEQWSGNAVPATDQYALAVMAYELLTGRPPFQGRPEQMMYLHFHVQPEPPSTFHPLLSNDVDSVILQALSKKPTDRFASISAFARAFQQAVAIDRPTIANTTRRPSGNDIRASLAISEAEARTGSTRKLTLPGGGQVTVSVPAGAYNGQIIRLENVAISSSFGSLAPALILTISVTSDEEQRAKSTFNGEKTIISGHDDSLGDWSRKLTRGLSKGTALLLILLALLVIAGSIGLFSYIRGSQIATANAAATATVQAHVIATINTLSTATAQAKATATIQAIGTATAKARAAATATAIAENPYPPSGATLALNDPLSDNSKGYNWGEDTNIGTCAFTDGAYHIRMPQQGRFHYCTAGITDFSNFVYEVQMKIVQGDQGGILFRAVAGQGRFYYFHISRTGVYGLDVYKDYNFIGAIKGGFSPAINTNLGQTNLIAVVVNGNTLDLYINKQHIASVSDSTFSHGQIGMAADDEGHFTEAVFSNAKVWML